MAEREQLQMYRQQLAAVEKMPAHTPGIVELKATLLEGIALLSEALGEKPKVVVNVVSGLAGGSTVSKARPQLAPKKQGDVWISLSEQKEDEVSSEDDMFSDAAWDKGAKRKAAVNVEVERQQARAEEAKKNGVQFVASGVLEPGALTKAMNAQASGPNRSIRNAEDDGQRISPEERQRRKEQMAREDAQGWQKVAVPAGEEGPRQAPGAGERGAEALEGIDGERIEGSDMEVSSSDDESHEDEDEDEDTCLHRKRRVAILEEEMPLAPAPDEAGLVEEVLTWSEIYHQPHALAESTTIGKWETSTRGVASRIMRKMGYVPGAGLGPEGEGIMNPVMAKWKRDKTGVGVEPEGGLNEMGDEDGYGRKKSKRRRGGRKKQVLARGLKEAEEKEDKGVVQVLSSVLMKGYGRAMQRKAEDGTTLQELTASMLHAREALGLANKQLQSLQAALERNKNQDVTRREIEQKMKLVRQHAAELQKDLERIQGKQDRLSGKKVSSKHFF